jgi:hypothetical protein
LGNDEVEYRAIFSERRFHALPYERFEKKKFGTCQAIITVTYYFRPILYGNTFGF